MISKKIKNLKIATVLPYKENYSFEKASAASLWVAEFFKNSKFKKNNFIYGYTKSKNFLTKNYININLKNIKSKIKSSTKEYSQKLIKEINNKKYDIVEIHNRPLILFNLIKKIETNFIFYFHNDPLSMKGSKRIDERLLILKNCCLIWCFLPVIGEACTYEKFLFLDRTKKVVSALKFLVLFLSLINKSCSSIPSLIEREP